MCHLQEEPVMDIRMSAQQVIRQADFLPLQKDWPERFGHKHDYVFLVYPGQGTDLDYFCIEEDWETLRGQDSLVPVVGRITQGVTGAKGLLVATGVTAEDFIRRQPQLLPVILNQLNVLAHRVCARSIGLAGIMPSIIEKREGQLGHCLSPLFVRGLIGSTWLVVSQVQKLICAPARVGIVGVGYLGGLVADELEKNGFGVVRVDRQKSPNYPNDLQRCQLVIALTPNGDDMQGYTEVICNGKSACRKLLFDCHPVPSPETVSLYVEAGIQVFQASATADGVSTQPALPNFQKSDIPGCMLDALLRSIIGDNGQGVDYKQFDQIARRVGIETPLLELTPELELVV